MQDWSRFRTRVFRLFEASTRLSKALAGLPKSQWVAPIESYVSAIAQLGTPATSLTDAVIVHGVLAVLDQASTHAEANYSRNATMFLEMLCERKGVRLAATKCLNRFVESLTTKPIDSGQDVIRLAREYIRANLSRRLTVREVALQSGCSTARLERLFRDHVKVTVHEYIADAKVTHAAELIASGEKVLAAMLLVGYSGKSSFGAQFRKRIGLPPGEYKQRQAKASINTPDRRYGRSEKT